ncbi:FecR family protein [Solitalea koreensis]|uniref:FecR family protein n=1 Tax=Solitalea koreensis TaxID=543615 RepID=A0A521DSS8_9SPHI|nr:FecR domain-containing protein [Solitalea koreensis]SMO74813.1 FecR family protein [Solitalea koreensis]
MMEHSNKPVNWDKLIDMLDSNSTPDTFLNLTVEEEEVLDDVKSIQKAIKETPILENINAENEWKRFVRLRNGGGETKVLLMWKQLRKFAAIAVLILISGVTGYYFLNDNKIGHAKTIASIKKEGRENEKVRLLLSDGKELVIADQKQVQSADGLLLNKKELNELQYSNPENKSVEVYNTLIVPKGETYKLLLSDGSQIWLNADSRLRFPVQFTGTNRNVWLEGEAYLEVVKDKTKPFFVHANDIDIKVLGTSFNVRAYSKDVQTTLLEGKVKMKSGIESVDQEIFLNPGQQGCFDTENRKLSLRNVDVDDFVAWKNGMIYFNNETLVQVMQELGRTYNYSVFYADEQLKTMKLSMNIDKQKEVDGVLRLIEKTAHLQFKINKNERSIVVTQKMD